MLGRLRALRGRDATDALVAAAIALVSVLGAVAAFRGSLADQEGSRLLRLSVIETAQSEQLTSVTTARLNEDLRNLAIYNEHLSAARSLEELASHETNPAVAASLRRQASGEQAIARIRPPFFFGNGPTASQSPPPAPPIALVPTPPPLSAPFPAPVLVPAPGAIAGDHGSVPHADPATARELRALNPEATRAAGEAAHHKSVLLTGLFVAFATALLVFTVARFVPWKRRVAVPGAVVTAGACVAFLLIERLA
jgi:hypothetical protein